MTHERKMTATTADGRAASMTLSENEGKVTARFEAERFAAVAISAKAEAVASIVAAPVPEEFCGRIHITPEFVTKREMDDALAALRAEIPRMIAAYLQSQKRRK